MRAISLFVLLTAVNASAEITPGSPVETPTGFASTVDDLVIKLGENSEAHFYFSGQRATSIAMKVAGRRSVFQLDTCALPREIRVDSMKLYRDDLSEGKYRTAELTLLFDVGSDKDRRCGKLPSISLTWTEGRLIQAWLIRQDGPNKATTLPLCYPDVQPNTSLERTRDR
jgi:hypothetical protein